jgi:aspartyl-tRNA(Asn)/glutamyl-tRNA(Gln) amidotransferase subunit C
MPLSREQVVHIATLCRVGTTEEDLTRAASQLSQILEQFEVLKQVNTDGVPPTAQSIPMHSVFRPDVPRPSLSQADALANAPRREGDFVRIKAVLEE